MAASVQFRLQNRDLGMVMREVDEDLAIFLGMKERNQHFIIENSDEFDESMRAENFQIVADDNLLSLEFGNSEYDWLTPEKIDLQDSATTNQTDVSKDEFISLKSEIAITCEKTATSTSSGSCNGANRKSSSSGNRKPAARASTPTGRRPSLPEKSKPSRATTPSSRAKSEPTRASSRATLTSSKPVSRSSTPSKAASSRSATPTRKPATPSTISTALKNPVPSRGSVQTLKLRPSKALDVPQNSKSSVPKRPASASRGRPAAHPSPKPRQKSCSPAKIRARNTQKVGKIMLSRSQGYGNGGSDNVNPVLMGTKMVERVVNMRKLAPPKHDDELVSLDKPKKYSSKDSSGFGRSLSKRSIDMAIRHMDIGRSLNIPDNLRPVSTDVSSRVSNGNQSSSSRSSTVGSSESPLTSTSDSSKSSNCVDSYFLDD